MSQTQLQVKDRFPNRIVFQRNYKLQEKKLQNACSPLTLSLNRSGGLGGKSYSIVCWLDSDIASVNVIATSTHKHNSSSRTWQMRGWSQRATEQFHLTVATLYRKRLILCLRKMPKQGLNLRGRRKQKKQLKSRIVP